MAEKQFYQGESFRSFDPGEVLKDADFDDCHFENCRWLGLRVENCSFNGCTFSHCNLSGVVFSFSRMKDAWLLGCAFRSMAWGSLQGRGHVFQPFGKAQNCVFRYNDFSGMALAGFDFSDCSFEQSVFDNCKLMGTSFNGARLGRTAFSRSDLTGADFRNAEGYAIDLTNNTLKDARFSFPDVVALLDGTGIKIE